MKRLKYAFDEAKVRRFLADGRGQGFGKDYRPWLTINDLPSRGRSHRVLGIKTGRPHHLLSDGEWKTFLRLDAEPAVRDIQEQFPLDRRVTSQVARDLGIKHPTTLNGTPGVLSLDFLVTRALAHGSAREGISFKYDPLSLEERQKDLHAVVAETLGRSGIAFRINDETLFNEHFEKNFDSIRACRNVAHLALYDPRQFGLLRLALIDAITHSCGATLRQACEYVGHRYRASAALVFTVAKHLIATQDLSVNLSMSLDLTDFPLSAFRIVNRGP